MSLQLHFADEQDFKSEIICVDFGSREGPRSWRGSASSRFMLVLLSTLATYSIVQLLLNKQVCN